jgi:hypothetical protein
MVSSSLPDGVAVQVAVQPYCLEQLVADRVHGAERGARLLEHQADLTTTHMQHLRPVGVELHQVQPLLAWCGPLLPEQDLAADDLAGLLDDPQERTRRDALAAAGLADQADHPTGRDVERHPVDGPDEAFGGLEVRRQVADRQQDVRPGHRSRLGRRGVSRCRGQRHLEVRLPRS